MIIKSSATGCHEQLGTGSVHRRTKPCARIGIFCSLSFNEYQDSTECRPSPLVLSTMEKSPILTSESTWKGNQNNIGALACNGSECSL